MKDSRRSLEQRAPVLAEISALLGSSLDYERALPRIVRLAVPALADLCAIDLLLEDGTIVAAYHEWSDDPKPLQYLLCTRFTV